MTKHSLLKHAVVTPASDSTAGIAVTTKYIRRDGPLDSANDYVWLSGKAIVDPYIPVSFFVLSASQFNEEDQCQWTFERRADEQDKFELTLGSAPEIVDVVTGSCMSTEHTFKSLGVYHVNVKLPDESASEAGIFWVKYVRREIHSYDNADRAALMKAWRTIAETNDATGVQMYGENFQSLGRLSTTHNNLAGDKECDHLHDGMGFVPGHISVTRILEASLQSVDASVSLPYWDYTIDVEEIGADGSFWAWRNVSVFSNDWFGEVDSKTGSISEGSYFDNFAIQANEWTTATNSYGLIRSPWNNHNSDRFVRFFGGGSALGEKASVGVTYDEMSSCSILDAALNQSTSLGIFNGEAAGQAHGPVHMFTGGQSGTPNYIDRLLDIGLDASSPHYEQDWGNGVTFNFASIKSLWRYNMWTCPESCSMDTPMSDCKCTCDADTIWKNASVVEALFASDIAMKDNVTVYKLLKMMCEMGPVMGDHASSGAASDPSFWVIHGTVERWLDLLIIEDRFEEQMWHTPENTVFDSNIHPFTAGCRGHQANDTLVFGLLDGFNFTNLEYYNYLNPTQPHTPYVYDNFRWPHCAALGHRIRHT